MTNRTFMTVEEVAAELGVSKSYAYKIVNLSVCWFAENWKIILYGTDRVSHQ